MRSGKVETYTYNGENQLIQSADNEGNQTTYTYDAFGNRIGKETITDKTKSFKGSLSEWITEYDKDSQKGKTTLAGQLETRAKETSKGCPAYAEASKDTTTKKGIQGKTNLKASDSSQRTTKLNQTVGYQTVNTIRYVNDLTQEYTQVAQLNETTEDDGETSTTKTAFRFGDDNQIIGTDEESYHENGLSDIATTSDGETNTDYDYTDYGTALATAPVANQIGYRAQMHDTSDTQNLRARNYDTNTGRFQQADNYRGALDDPRSQNRYIYGVNNPMSFGDPSGNIPKWLKKATKKAKKAVKNVSKGVKKVKQVVKKTVKKVKRVVKKVQKVIKKTTKKIKRAVKKATKKVQKTVTKFKKAAKKSIKQVTKTAKKVYKAAKKVVQKKYNQVKQTVKKKVQTVKKAGKKVISKAKSAIKTISKETKKQVVKAGAKLLVAQADYNIRAEKAKKAICDNLLAMGAGALDSLANSFTFGAVETINKNKEVYGDDNSYYIGRLLVDFEGVVLGIEGIIFGLGTEAGGVVLDFTGAGTAIGVQLNIAGLTIITGSAALIASSGANFFQDANDLFSNIEKNKDKAKSDNATKAAEEASGVDVENIIKKGEKMPNHKVVENGGLPKDGKPNSSADILNPDGSVKQRRYYDDKGRAKEDIDFNHSDDGTHEFPHRHKWDWTNPAKPKRLK
ncbi:RHS repeat protein [Listeria marthii]|uniref:RHS repeat protein n=1 Tax=Listeria marthii TaxID=529731 RepID=UPI0021AE238F|nr:RHS repeat-associated core domain-containing protein [Listeria marthii]